MLTSTSSDPSAQPVQPSDQTVGHVACQPLATRSGFRRSAPAWQNGRVTDPEGLTSPRPTPADAAPAVPFFLLNELSLQAAGEGIAQCRSEVLPWLEGTPELGIHAGVAGLMDIVLSYAASTAATETEMFVSLGMRIQHWETPPPVGTTLNGTASVQTAHRGMVLTGGRITAGELTVASGTLQSMTAPRVASVAGDAGDGRARQIPRTAPHDSQIRSTPASPESYGSSPNEKLLSQVLELPVSRMCDLGVEGGDGDQISLAVVPPPSFERTGGVIHGGAVPILGQLACTALIAGTLEPDREARRIEFAVDYLRPAFVEKPYTLTAAVIHRSRRVMIIAGEILDETGKMTSRYSETSILGDRLT